LAEAQESLQKATAKLKSIKCQHQKQCQELIEDKGALLVGLEDEQTLSSKLRLTIEVQTLTRGNKTLAEGINELNEKLAVAESRSKADTANWATEHQRLKDDVTRSQQKELQAKTERDPANEGINQVRTEEEEFKQLTISKRSAFPSLVDEKASGSVFVKDPFHPAGSR
jgi:hypothetical protein